MTRRDVAQLTGAVQAGVPLPLPRDADWFQTVENSVSSNFDKSRIDLERVDRAAMVAAALKAGRSNRSSS